MKIIIFWIFEKSRENTLEALTATSIQNLLSETDIVKVPKTPRT